MPVPMIPTTLAPGCQLQTSESCRDVAWAHESPQHLQPGTQQAPSKGLLNPAASGGPSLPNRYLPVMRGPHLIGSARPIVNA